jgi:translation initiation factor 2 subunit 1
MELPEEDELVIAIIRKILPYGAFCVLPEYNDAEAFLHVSEVAPRWIKNIHEFISEGQRCVVKVYHVDKEKGQIDVSLKRVSEEEKRKKLESLEREKKAVNLLSLAIEEANVDVKFEELRQILEGKFGDLYSVFLTAYEKGDAAFKGVNIPDALKHALIDVAKRNIKKQLVQIKGIVTLKCYGEDGVEKIKEALSVKKDNVTFHYLGAPRYQLILTASDYKEGERELAAVIKSIKTFANKNNCSFEFVRS